MTEFTPKFDDREVPSTERIRYLGKLVARLVDKNDATTRGTSSPQIYPAGDSAELLCYRPRSTSRQNSPTMQLLATLDHGTYAISLWELFANGDNPHLDVIVSVPPSKETRMKVWRHRAGAWAMKCIERLKSSETPTTASEYRRRQDPGSTTIKVQLQDGEARPAETYEVERLIEAVKHVVGGARDSE